MGSKAEPAKCTETHFILYMGSDCPNRDASLLSTSTFKQRARDETIHPWGQERHKNQDFVVPFEVPHRYGFRMAYRLGRTGLHPGLGESLVLHSELNCTRAFPLWAPLSRRVFRKAAGEGLFPDVPCCVSRMVEFWSNAYQFRKLLALTAVTWGTRLRWLLGSVEFVVWSSRKKNPSGPDQNSASAHVWWWSHPVRVTVIATTCHEFPVLV